MKYVNEFRQPDLVRKLTDAIHETTTSDWTVMEVCGGQTHSIMKFALHDLLPDKIRLIHGPGCPVCVTPIELIDHALHIASLPNTVLCTFADMIRVPGTQTDLLTLKAKGADVRLINSPLDSIRIAQQHLEKQVVFFAVGFETTASPNAMAVYQAKRLGLSNFSMLASHVLVPPALIHLLRSADNEVQGFLAAGHVCTVTGYEEYHSIASRFKTPIVITGFEPLDLLQGLYFCVQMLEKKSCQVINQYNRTVQEEGNHSSKILLNEVFKRVDRRWRGIGDIPLSGFDLREEYAGHDAALRFPYSEKLTLGKGMREKGCLSGLILQGRKKPCECPFFGKSCTPENPLGAPMVSQEGACSAYYHYSQIIQQKEVRHE